MSQAHRELCWYEPVNGNLNVPLIPFKTPPQERASVWQFRPILPGRHTHRYIPRPPGTHVPPFVHGLGEQLLVRRIHRGGAVFGGHSQRKPNALTGKHVPPLWHGFSEQPSNVEFERTHPNGPIPLPVKCGGQMHVIANPFRIQVACGWQIFGVLHWLGRNGAFDGLAVSDIWIQILPSPVYPNGHWAHFDDPWNRKSFIKNSM